MTACFSLPVSNLTTRGFDCQVDSKVPAILPNLGGSLPNDIFANILKLPTLWVPHASRMPAQHATNEHLPIALACEALRIMAGLYWDLGERHT